MVSAGYMLDRRPSASQFKRFVDQQAIPAAIDAAAGVEAVVEDAAQLVRRQPLAAIAVAVSCGLLTAALYRRKPRIVRRFRSYRS